MNRCRELDNSLVWDLGGARGWGPAPLLRTRPTATRNLGQDAFEEIQDAGRVRRRVELESGPVASGDFSRPVLVKLAGPEFAANSQVIGNDQSGMGDLA